MTQYYWYSSYSVDVVNRMIEKGWLAHNFQIENYSDVYNPAGFKRHVELSGVTYTLNVDLNIYQFILNSHKKGTDKEIFKDAVALILFCQMSNIIIEPTYAIYEKIAYRKDEHILNEVLDDLELFYRIDSANSDSLASYLLGLSDSYELAPAKKIDRKFLAGEFTKYRRLKEWDCMYLMVLKLTYITNGSSLSKNEKLKKYVQWLITDYRLSLVAIIFGIVFFGRKPLKKMLKYKESQTPQQKHASISNMAWDLYIMNQYFRAWIKQESKSELMYASDDKAFVAVLRHAVDVQNSGDLLCMADHVDKNVLSYINQITADPENHFSRAYQSSCWSPGYRASLIDKYEKLLGVGNNKT